MPIYEYRCSTCDRIIEVLQKTDDPAPKCHGDMKKLMSNNSFILKGTGWYVTDYKNKKKSKEAPMKPIPGGPPRPKPPRES